MTMPVTTQIISRDLYRQSSFEEHLSFMYE